MTINSAGDIGLANNSVFIDRSADRIGIGTTVPGFELQINDTRPEIRLRDESDNTSANIQYNAGFLALEGNGEQDIVRIEGTAPANSLFIDTSGRIGIGTASPNTDSALHVRRSTGAQVLVENFSGILASRVPFKLVNNGKIRFSMQRTDGTSGIWTFDHSDTTFDISRVGTGAAEFKLRTNGDGTFLGAVFATAFNTVSSVDAKTGFASVDEKDVLARLAELPISTWRYKSERSGVTHMGPMAEDFHKGFGLGADDRHITLMDAAGVALAAIKAQQVEMPQDGSVS